MQQCVNSPWSDNNEKKKKKKKIKQQKKVSDFIWQD